MGIEKVTFMSARNNELTKTFGSPIYGRVNAGRKGTFTGLIHWDEDERFLEEVLDGKDRGDDREIPFKSIKSIEKESKIFVRGKNLLTLSSFDNNDPEYINSGYFNYATFREYAVGLNIAF